MNQLCKIVLQNREVDFLFGPPDTKHILIQSAFHRFNLNTQAIGLYSVGTCFNFLFTLPCGFGDDLALPEATPTGDGVLRLGRGRRTTGGS